MGHLLFYLFVVAACLLWSAAFVAGAARTERPWLRWLLTVVAVVVPALGLAPWVAVTAGLARMNLHANWFAPTLSAFIAALVAGLWIAVAGLARRPSGGRRVAAAWPLVGLAALFVMAKSVSFGTLLFIDNAVAAEGRMLRVEAAQIMAAALPPAPTADNNAAPLYHRALAALAADKTLVEAESPCTNPLTADPGSPDVAAILDRHATALDLLRRAADRPGCRFDRDWSRPSFAMLLPEVHEVRQAARLLILAARKAAADGDGAQAIADIVRIHRLAVHAAGEPVLVSSLVGQAIDSLALETLADVLPRLGKSDLPLLDGDSFRDFVATPIRYQRAFLGEEAFGLATLADLTDCRTGPTTLDRVRALSDAGPLAPVVGTPLLLLYRCFLLPADIAGYRDILSRSQALVAALSRPTPQAATTLAKQAAEIEEDLTSRRAGIFSALMAPALAAAVTSQSKGEARHDAAGVLVAATRIRLAGGSLPDTLEALVPDALPELPRDPFTADAPLVSKRAGDAWLVYSVGPDGEDDGGPVPDGSELGEGNDDVGLAMAITAE